MRDDLPSVTACFVAWARTVASMAPAGSLDPGDAVSRALLPLPFGLAADAVAQVGQVAPWVPRAAFGLSLGLFDHLVLRTAAIDDALRHAVARGADQLVILGAGLDGRAHRIHELRDVTVFEVDHPVSQRFKRRKAAAVAVLAKEVRYVPVNFERDRLVDELRTAGFDAHRKSFWIWEGVTPYLQRRAIDETLAAVFALSAPGSEIVATYVSNESQWVRRRRMLTQSALSVIGEPLVTQLDPAEAASIFTRAGFHVIADTRTTDWHAKYARDPSKRSVPPLEHIIHAGREPHPSHDSSRP